MKIETKNWRFHNISEVWIQHDTLIVIATAQEDTWLNSLGKATVQCSLACVLQAGAEGSQACGKGDSWEGYLWPCGLTPLSGASNVPVAIATTNNA